MTDDPEAILALSGGLWGSIFGRRYGADWETLTTQHRYVVVLGEARSGKTYELRARAEHLLGHARYGFYATLADVSQSGLLDALPVDQQGSYKEWLASTDEAIILIDSADEARALQGIRLQHGVRRLRKDLAEAFVRIRLVLACRVSDWRSGQDIQELQDALGIVSKEESGSLPPPQNIHLYQLVALDEEQITKIAEWKFGDAQVSRKQFLENLWKSQRWIFAGRPADLIWLIEYWKTKEQFGSFTEITEENIKKKLLEQNLDYRAEAHLDATRTRDGARRLAAALLLGRAAALSLVGTAAADNSSERTVPASHSIDPGDILSDFRPKEIDELLSRPIFDEATYGRVRFHHRTVLEFLTADWLKALHSRGCPPSEIVKLLFDEVHGQTTLIRSRAPVAAWLAPYIREVYLALQEYAPEALLTQADPAQLPDEEVAAALLCCARRYRDRRRAYSLLEDGNLTLHQLASLRLEETIYKLLDEYRESRDIVIFLLKIIATAKWQSRCAQIGDFALSKNCDESIRMWSIRTLAQLDDTTQRMRLANMARCDADLSNEIRSNLCNTLYPAVLNVSECLILLLGADSAKKGRVGSGIEAELGFHLPEVCLPSDLTTLLQGLLNFSQEVVRNRNVDVLGSTFGWLYQGVSSLVIKIIKLNPASAHHLPLLKLAFSFLELGIERSKYHDYKSMQAAFKEHASIGRALALSLYIERPAWLYIGDFSSMHPKLYKFGVEDVAWLILQAKEHENPFARRLSLFTLIAIWQEVGLEDQIVREIESLAQIMQEAAQAVQTTLKVKQEKPSNEARARERLKEEDVEREQRENATREWERREKSRRHELLQKIETGSLSNPDVERLIRQIFEHHIDDGKDEFLRALLTHQKEHITTYVQNQMDREWNFEQVPLPSVVSYVAYRPATIRKHFAPHLLTQLLQSDPKQVDILKDAFFIIYKDCNVVSDERFADLAATRAANALTEAHRIEWIVAWLHLNGRAAWEFIKKNIILHKEPKKFITNLAASAQKHFGEKSIGHYADLSSHLNGFLQMPDVIGSILKLLYLNLPPEEDHDDDDTHMRGVTAPMYAGEYRDYLASHLRKLRTIKAHQVLLKLANDPELLQYRDFLLRLDDLHVVDLAEHQNPSWRSSSINDFAQSYINPPQTDLQLFRLIHAHFLVISNAIGRGADFSYREILCRFEHERELQKWVASELHKQRPTFYRVSRESEVAKSNKPDILIFSERCQGRIPIEIKPTARDQHSYNYYVNKALQVQIIDQYMIDYDTRFGFLLLLHTKSRTWEKPDGTIIDSFCALVEDLNLAANRLIETRPNIEKILVFGIDLT